MSAVCPEKEDGRRGTSRRPRDMWLGATTGLGNAECEVLLGLGGCEVRLPVWVNVRCYSQFGSVWIVVGCVCVCLCLRVHLCMSQVEKQFAD